jgi:hypothetical protein
VWPIARVSAGGGIYPQAGDAKGFDLDVAAGATVGFDREWFLRGIQIVPEACYSFGSHPKMGGHLAGIGVGLSYFPNMTFGIGWAPKLVLGSTHEGFGIGVRNMLVLTPIAGLLQVEAGHQWLRVEGQDQHEMRILAGVDLSRVVMFALLVTQHSYK